MAETNQPLPVKQQNACGGKQRIDEDIGERYTVNAEMRNQQEVRNQRQHSANTEKKVYVFLFPDDNENHIGKADVVS